jgi:putative transposase
MIFRTSELSVLRKVPKRTKIMSKTDNIIRLDEAQLREHLDRKITESVEETLNGLLDAEADRLCGARHYEHSADRVDTRAGHYERKLDTKEGEVNIKMPKLRNLAFETQIIERYRRKESSVEEALMEMYLAGAVSRTSLRLCGA